MPPTLRRRATAEQAAPAPTASSPRRAAAPRRSPARAAEAPRLAPIGEGVNFERRMQLEYLHIDEITPYEYNPRDNEKAIPAVASSIRSFGFLVPVVVDANNVLVAGHTRWAAARLLGIQDIPCLRAAYLSPTQIAAFRVIDNKVSEQAQWDHDLLAGEIAKLGDVGINWTSFGWSQSEIDCLSEIVADTCLDAPVVVSESEVTSVSERRAPATARMVLGEVVFFVPATAYRTWVDGIRNLCGFSEQAIAAELKRRLGLPQE